MSDRSNNEKTFLMGDEVEGDEEDQQPLAIPPPPLSLSSSSPSSKSYVPAPDYKYRRLTSRSGQREGVSNNLTHTYNPLLNKHDDPNGATAGDLYQDVPTTTPVHPQSPIRRRRNSPFGLGTPPPPPPIQNQQVKPSKKPHYSKWSLNNFVAKVPSVLLAVLLNLMLSVPFGSAFFPIPSSTFPCHIPQIIGVRLFLFSTVASQIVLDVTSGFDGAIGMMMVENTAFMNSIGYSIMGYLNDNPIGGGDHEHAHEHEHEQCDPRVLPTILATFALSTVLTAASFYLLGYFSLGNIVYFFPKHVILGCVSGIGVFVLTTGLEVSTGETLKLTLTGINDFFFESEKTKYLYLLPLFLVVILRITQRVLIAYKKDLPLLPPLFFLTITPLFYGGLYLLNVDVEDVRDDGFLFPPTTPSVDHGSHSEGSVSGVSTGPVNPSSLYAIFFPTYSLAEGYSNPFELVNFSAILTTIPTLLGLIVFSLMHVPINIPSLSISTGVEVHMNTEMKSHGISNLLSAMFLGLPNYMCYSNSISYYRSGGGGRVSSVFIAVLTMVLFFVGGKLVVVIPRAMAGTLLIHVGVDLFLEGVYDSYNSGFDHLEYTSIWLIVLVMSVSGMTTGLAAGMVLAAITFVVNANVHLDPVRGAMPATTLRSSKWRGLEARKILDDRAAGRGAILCVQLQSHIYFTNQVNVSNGVNDLLLTAHAKVKYVILDFTLVVGIDSSAVFTIIKLCDILKNSGATTVCFVTGHEDGFPCTINMSEQLQSKGAVVVQDLDSALMICEDLIIHKQSPGLVNDGFWGHKKNWAEGGGGLGTEHDLVIKMMVRHCPFERNEDIKKLLSYFKRVEVNPGEVMWRQGDQADRLLLVVDGELISELEEEAGTFETVDKGAIIGELALVLGDEGRRFTTVKTVSKCVCMVLDDDAWRRMKNEGGGVCSRMVLMICIRYLSHRVQHVSNRIAETNCMPI